MKAIPIRIRLAAWYSAVLAATFIIVAVVVLEGTSRIMLRAVDDELQDHIAGFRSLLNRQPSDNDYIDTFLQHSGAGDLIQVNDKAGNRLYTSPAAVGLDFAVPKVGPNEYRYDTAVAEGNPFRLLTWGLMANGSEYQVQVATPLSNYKHSNQRLLAMMLVFMPVLLLVASAGGYWLSRRALSPVDEITARARAISGRNWSNRLPVPATRDELQRLSETLNAMLERLEAAYNKIIQFTADASHELRAPLALIQITAEVSTRHPRSEEEYRCSLEQILSETKKTSILVENLLTLARSDSQSDTLAKCRMNLLEPVGEAYRRGQIMGESKNLQFRADLCPGPVWIEGNSEALLRLFLILMDNAIKYTRSGGSVSVKVAVNGTTARICVEDNGIGISEKDLPHIFERFYRADKARSRTEGGSGLGLAIGRWIVETHSGTISCRSTLNAGSVFEINLPLSH